MENNQVNDMKTRAFSQRTNGTGSFSFSQAFCTFLLLLFLWEASVLIYREYAASENSGVFFQIVLPAPSHILYEIVTRWSLLWPHFSATCFGIVGSLSIAVIASVPIGLGMATSKKMSNLFQTFFLLFKSVPSFCFVPILILLSGWGGVSAFLPAVLAALFPMTMSIFEGIRKESKSTQEYFRMMNATSFQKFIRLHVPTILASIFAGLRIAIAGSGMATIAGEWCGARNGLGILLMDMREQMDVPMMFACIALVSLISMCLYISSNCLEVTLQPEKRREWIRKLRKVGQYLKK